MTTKISLKKSPKKKPSGYLKKEKKIFFIPASSYLLGFPRFSTSNFRTYFEKNSKLIIRILIQGWV